MKDFLNNLIENQDEIQKNPLKAFMLFVAAKFEKDDLKIKTLETKIDEQKLEFEKFKISMTTKMSIYVGVISVVLTIIVNVMIAVLKIKI